MNFSDLKEFKYGWKVVFSSAMGIGLGMSPLPFYTIGVFAIPLTKQFGWGMDDVMLALPVFTIAAIFMSPLIGLIADKYGARKTVLVSVLLFGLTFIAFMLNTGNKTLYLILWALLSITGAGTLPMTWTRAVNNWFTKNRGLALGVTLMGTGLFGAGAKLYASYLIGNYGWKMAYLGVGALPLLIALPIAFLWFRDINDKKVAKRAAALKAEYPDTVSTEVYGMNLGQAFKDKKFWLLALAFIPISFAVGGPIPNLEKMLNSKGFDFNQAVILASFLGYSVLAGRVIGGYLIDRFWAPAVSFVLLCAPAISCYILFQPEVSYSMAVLAITILGFAAGVEYDILGFLVSKYFGMKYYSTIYGMLYSFFALGAGFGPYIFSRSFTETGSYDQILFYAAFAFVIGSIPLLFLGKYRNFGSEGLIKDA